MPAESMRRMCMPMAVETRRVNRAPAGKPMPKATMAPTMARLPMPRPFSWCKRTPTSTRPHSPMENVMSRSALTESAPAIRTPSKKA
eukprot:5184431-Prymnesium_polylepis.1